MSNNGWESVPWDEDKEVIKWLAIMFFGFVGIGFLAWLTE